MTLPRGVRNKPAAGLATGRTILIVLAALVLGALVLKRGWGNDTTDTSAAPGAATTLKNGATTTAATTLAPTTTTVALNLATNKVMVANGAGKQGIAGRVTDKLKAKGYTVVAATNATVQAATSAVYYTAGVGANQVAKFTAQDLGIAPGQVLQMPAGTKPVLDVKDAQVLVVIGLDFNETTIPAANALPAAAAPAAAVTQAPAVVTAAPGATTTIKK